MFVKLRNAAAAAGALAAAYAALDRLKDKRSEFRPVQRLLVQAHHVLPDKQRTAFQKWTLKQVYEQVSKSSDEATNAFLNYGYAALEAPHDTLDLPEIRPDERTGMQLYHHVASAVEIKGLEVLEVGCGRGGGTSFIFDYLEPKRMVGVDLAERAVANANRAYGRPGLTYEVGDAENLQFDDQSFDVVLNVESSHCYPNVDRFMAEVFRVLRPGGHLVMADLRPIEEIDNLRAHLSGSGLEVLVEEDITANVVTALEQESDRRIALIEETAPKAMWPQMKDFAGVVGTSGFEHFANRDRLYLRFVARRPLADAEIVDSGAQAVPQPPTEPASITADTATTTNTGVEEADRSASAGGSASPSLSPKGPQASTPQPRQNRGVLSRRRSNASRAGGTVRPTRSLPLVGDRRVRYRRQPPIARRRPGSGRRTW